MTSEEMEIAMVDIGLGRTWDECRINNKNAAKKKSWDELVADFKLANKNGWTIEIPMD